MADSDVHEAIQLDADISALVSPSVSELWRAMHGYPAEATGAVATHRALNAGGGSLPAGGATGQVLTKASGADDDVVWSGGSTSREDFVGGGTVDIGNGSNDRLNWLKIGGSTLLDLTDPSIPVVITAGAYAVAASPSAFTDMAVGGFYGVILELDSDGDDAAAEIESRTATAAKPQPRVAVAGTYYIPAGGTIRLKVFNYDGASTVTFGIASAFIQRLS